MEEYDILGAVDRGLERFGSHMKQTLYWKITILHTSLHYSIIENPETFVSVLDEHFGEMSSQAKRSIIRELKKVFELVGVDDLLEALLSVRKQIAPTISSSPLN